MNTKEKGRGSTGRGHGRPLQGTEKRKRFQVTLPPSVMGMARELGDGNASAGLEFSVRALHGLIEVRIGKLRKARPDGNSKNKGGTQK